MLYQYKPTPHDPQAGILPYGFRLKVINGTRQADRVQVKDTAGNPLGFVLLRSLEVMK
jgi:hypothetical protein